MDSGASDIVAWAEVMADVALGLERVTDAVAITEVSVVVLEMAGVKEFGDPKNTVEEKEYVELGPEDVVCAAAAVGTGPVIVLVVVTAVT